MNRLQRIALVTVAFVSAGTLLARAQDSPASQPPTPELHTRPAPPDYTTDPKFQKALEQAKAPHQTQEDHLDNWKHANKVAHGQCVECLHQMVLLQMKLSAWKDVVNTTQQLEALSDEPRQKLFAEAQRGHALMHFNYGNPKPEQLTQADAAFRDVLAKAPREKSIVFEEGRALAMMGKNDEAKAMFDRYVGMVPASDRLRGRAERFSDDPHLATFPMAPPFRMVTTDGQELELDDMNGKVVLLDFWATWCGPCKETLPEVARIAKQYANDPMLVVISVSQDRDENAWKTFVQKNNMTWPQYRDANNELGTAYGVSSIPRFFSIDPNGILKSEQIGSNANVGGMVADLLKKAHKAEAEKAKASEKAGGQ